MQTVHVNDGPYRTVTLTLGISHTTTSRQFEMRSGRPRVEKAPLHSPGDIDNPRHFATTPS
jgi:hypothetical protein